MERHDLEAMRLAISTLRKDHPELRATIEAMLRSQGEQEVGLFAVGFCQVKNLHLKGWECPPCDTFDADPSDCYGRRPNEIALLRRMLAAGVSRFHPDPMQALAAIDRAA